MRSCCWSKEFREERFTNLGTFSVDLVGLCLYRQSIVDQLLFLATNQCVLNEFTIKAALCMSGSQGLDQIFRQELSQIGVENSVCEKENSIFLAWKERHGIFDNISESTFGNCDWIWVWKQKNEGANAAKTPLLSWFCQTALSWKGRASPCHCFYRCSWRCPMKVRPRWNGQSRF